MFDFDDKKSISDWARHNYAQVLPRLHRFAEKHKLPSPQYEIQNLLPPIDSLSVIEWQNLAGKMGHMGMIIRELYPDLSDYEIDVFLSDERHRPPCRCREDRLEYGLRRFRNGNLVMFRFCNICHLISANPTTKFKLKSHIIARAHIWEIIPDCSEEIPNETRQKWNEEKFWRRTERQPYIMEDINDGSFYDPPESAGWV